MSESAEEFMNRFRAMRPEEKLAYVRSCRVTNPESQPEEQRRWFERANAEALSQHSTMDHPPLRVVDRRARKAG